MQTISCSLWLLKLIEQELCYFHDHHGWKDCSAHLGGLKNHHPKMKMLWLKFLGLKKIVPTVLLKEEWRRNCDVGATIRWPVKSHSLFYGRAIHKLSLKAVNLKKLPDNLFLTVLLTCTTGSIGISGAINPSWIDLFWQSCCCFYGYCWEVISWLLLSTFLLGFSWILRAKFWLKYVVYEKCHFFAATTCHCSNIQHFIIAECSLICCSSWPVFTRGVFFSVFFAVFWWSFTL